MIPFSANIVSEGITGGDLTTKQFNAVKRQAYKETGEEFHRKNVPRRFTWAGARMLGFPRRSEKYIRANKGQPPNVKSGVSRKLATSIRDVRVTATRARTRTRISLHARGLNRSNPKSPNKVKPSEDVKRIADREVPPLVAFLSKRLQDGLANEPNVKTTQSIS